MLSDAAIALAVFSTLQLCKPVLTARLMPQDKSWQNAAYRGLGYVVSYVLELGNAATQHPLTFAVAWSLLPVAGAVYGLAAVTWHMGQEQADAPPSSGPPS